MSDPSATSRVVRSDEALLSRVQHENQKQIVGKLLHDLRNPIHSMRITMELFSRIARREGDIETLMQRAAAYIGPAQNALESLLTNGDRLGTYLGTPTSAAIAPLPLQDWIEEIALLLRASKRPMQVAVSVEADPASCLLADRPRLSHAILHCCLSNGSSHVTLRAREESDALVRIDASFAADEASSACTGPGVAGLSSEEAVRLSSEELDLLIKNAGGTLIAAAGGSVSMRFGASGFSASG